MRTERHGQGHGHGHGVLVPVYDGDITDSALARARAELDDPDTRLVLLHVVHPGRGPRRAPPREASPPRWRRLVARARPDRVVVDAVLDDAAPVEPARALAAYAERFGCDVVVADRPSREPPHAATEGGEHPRARHPRRHEEAPC